MVLRQARPEEAALLSALAMRSKAYWGYSSAFMQACREELTWSPEQLAAPQVDFVVAETEAGVVGFYALEHLSGEEFELAALFVEPSCIGQGVGRTLIEHAKAQAVNRGGRVLLIQGDPHAERFYRAAGAEIVGEQPSQSIPGRFLPVFVITLRSG
jgi:N-acetylglutamate synthase-like GNAT family acetyltransferase